MDVVVPPDEFRMLDNLNRLDANGVEQRDRISRPNVKKGSDHAADFCANLDNAIHMLTLPRPSMVLFNALR